MLLSIHLSYRRNRSDRNASTVIKARSVVIGLGANIVKVQESKEKLFNAELVKRGRGRNHE